MPFIEQLYGAVPDNNNSIVPIGVSTPGYSYTASTNPTDAHLVFENTGVWTAADATTPQYIQVQCPAPHYIGNYKFYRGSNIIGTKVYGSNDGATWTLLDSTPTQAVTSGSPGYHYLYSCGSRKGTYTYFRVELIGDGVNPVGLGVVQLLEQYPYTNHPENILPAWGIDTYLYSSWMCQYGIDRLEETDFSEYNDLWCPTELITKTFAGGRIVSGYTICAGENRYAVGIGTSSATAWVLSATTSTRYAIDPNDWDTIDTVSGETTWGACEQRTFTLSSPTPAYDMWKWVPTARDDGTSGAPIECGVREFELLGVVTTPAVTSLAATDEGVTSFTANGNMTAVGVKTTDKWLGNAETATDNAASPPLNPQISACRVHQYRDWGWSGYSNPPIGDWMSWETSDGVARIVNKYSFFKDGLVILRSFRFEGSNTGLGGPWTILDEQTDASGFTGNNEFDIPSNQTAYRYYRFYIVDASGFGFQLEIPYFSLYFISITRGFVVKQGTTGDLPTIGPYDADNYDFVSYEKGDFNIGTYSLSVTGLTEDTGYRYRAFVTDGYQTVYGSLLTTQTTAAVETLTPFPIFSTKATLNGNILASSATRRGFCYKAGTTGAPTIADSTVYEDSAGWPEGAYSLEITGLTPETTYRIRSYVLIGANIFYGDVVSATTLVPTLTTSNASSVTASSCTGNGTITVIGEDLCTRRGFCYMLSSTLLETPTIANSVAYDDSVTGFSLGAYTKAITGLSSDANYRIRAYMIVGGVIYYGNTVTFKTLPIYHIREFKTHLVANEFNPLRLEDVPKGNYWKDPFIKKVK